MLPSSRVGGGLWEHTAGQAVGAQDLLCCFSYEAFVSYSTMHLCR